MRDGWYRRKTWTEKDREEFFARLRRSRSAFHKAQYACGQAGELLATHKRKGYLAALELLDMVMAEWPEEGQRASVYQMRAECFVGLGDLPRAVEAYRLVFQKQRAFKYELTNAHLDFGWLVATRPLPKLYEEALGVLDEFIDENEPCSFPIERYRANAILALILDAVGERQEAREYARAALEEAAAKHSGLRYHAQLGLVKLSDGKVHERLRELATQ